MAGGFDGKDGRESAVLAPPAPRTGLVASIGAQPLSQDLFKLAPRSSVIVTAGRFSLGGFVHAIINGIGPPDPQAGQQVEQGIAQVSQGLGFDVRKDFLAAFGDEWLGYTDPNSGGYGLTGSVLVNRPAHAPKLGQS